MELLLTVLLATGVALGLLGLVVLLLGALVEPVADHDLRRPGRRAA